GTLLRLGDSAERNCRSTMHCTVRTDRTCSPTVGGFLSEPGECGRLCTLHDCNRVARSTRTGFVAVFWADYLRNPDAHLLQHLLRSAVEHYRWHELVRSIRYRDLRNNARQNRPRPIGGALLLLCHAVPHGNRGVPVHAVEKYRACSVHG